MHGDEERRSCTKSGEGEVAELRRAIDHDDVVSALDRFECLRDAVEEQRLAWSSLAECPGRFVLELHEFEVGRDEIESGEVRRANNRFERTPFGIVTHCAVQRLVLANLKLRLHAEESRHASLRVEVECQDAVALKDEILGQVRRRRGLARTALEVRDRDDLKVIVFAASRLVATAAARVFVEVRAQPMDVCEAVGTAPGWRNFRLRTKSLGCELLDA